MWWRSGKPSSAREVFRLRCSCFIYICFIWNSPKPGLYYQEEESRCRLQIYMRLGNKLIAYLAHLRKACVWVWMKRHSYTSEKALPTHSLPKLAIWYAFASAGPLVAMPLPHTRTRRPICVRGGRGSWLRGTTLPPACTAAAAPARGLRHVCRHGQGGQHSPGAGW